MERRYKLALLLCFLSAVFAAISFRPFTGDGSFWLFRIISTHTLAYDFWQRSFDTVNQFPGLFLLSVFPRTDFSAALGIYTLNLAYCLHPFFSLLVTFLILKRLKQTRFFIFPLISFALATQATIANAVGVVPTALSLFWPLFFLVLFYRNAFILPIVLLMSGLAFTYETTLLFFSLFIVIAIRRLRSKKKKEYGDVILIALSLAAITWHLQRIFGYKSSDTLPFLDSIIQGFVEHPYSIFVYILTAVFIAVICAEFYLKKNSKLKNKLWVAVNVSIPVVSTILVIHYLVSRNGMTLTSAFELRTIAIPISFLIAASCYLYSLKPQKKSFDKNITTFVTALLVISAVHDTALTLRFRTASNTLKTLLSQTDCQTIDPKLGNKKMAKYGIANWSVPFASVVLQQKRTIDRIVFVKEKDKPDPCKSFRDNAFTFKIEDVEMEVQFNPSFIEYR